MYSVKEIFYSIQGEGARTGRASIFLRFAGCNLWSGREEDRENAICNFCDTDFIGTDGTYGGKYKTAQDLADKIMQIWPQYINPYIVCTGGEPLLQIDEQFINVFHENGFEIAIETNGTIKAPQGLDWICMSPKQKMNLLVTSGDELKFIYPQVHISPEDFGHLNFKYFFLQPMDSPQIKENTLLAIEYCLNHPQWRLSLQTHKLLGVR
ncbi:MAG: 7-carboxy-7-deazaguanine synthase [Saprospiraceae bacterium]